MHTLTNMWLDIALVVMLVTNIAIGFHQGLARQLTLLISFYISIVLSFQYHMLLAGLIIWAFKSTTWVIAELVAFLILVGVFAVIVTWVLWTAYCETKLPSTLSVIDELGGAMLGGITGAFLLSIVLLLIRYALQAPWPEGSPIKYILYTGMLNSSLQSAFSSPLPLVQASLRPWLPSGIAFMLGS